MMVHACPDPSELAAFLDGRLQGATRRHVAAHVDDCPHCYDMATDIMRALADQPEGDQEAVSSAGGERNPFWHSFPRSFYWMGVPLTGAVLWVVFALAPWRLSPSYQDLAHSALVALHHQGRPLDRFQLALEVDPSLLTPRARRGESGSEVTLPEVDRAVAALSAVSRHDRNYLDARLTLISLMLASGQFATALEWAEQLRTEWPQDAETLGLHALATYLYGRDKARRGFMDDGIAHMHKLRDAYPRHVMIAFNFASMLEIDGQDAANAWDTFLRLSPEGPYAEIARRRRNLEPDPE